MDKDDKERSGSEMEEIKTVQKQQKEKVESNEDSDQVYRPNLANTYQRMRNEFLTYISSHASSLSEKKDEQEFLLSFKLPSLRTISKQFQKIRDCDSLKVLLRISTHFQLSLKVIFRIFEQWHRDPTFQIMLVHLKFKAARQNIQLFAELRLAVIKIIEVNPMLTIEEIVEAIRKSSKFEGYSDNLTQKVESALRLSGYEFSLIKGDNLQINSVVQLKNRGTVSESIVNYLFQGFALYFIDSMKVNLYSERRFGWMKENTNKLPKFYDEYANQGEHATVIGIFSSTQEKMDFEISDGNFSKQGLHQILKKMLNQLVGTSYEQKKQKEKQKDKEAESRKSKKTAKDKEEDKRVEKQILKPEQKVLIFTSQKAKELRCDRFIKQQNFIVLEMPAGCSWLNPIRIFFEQIRQTRQNKQAPTKGKLQEIGSVVEQLKKCIKIDNNTKEKKEENSKEKTLYKSFLSNIELAAYGSHF